MNVHVIDSPHYKILCDGTYVATRNTNANLVCIGSCLFYKLQNKAAHNPFIHFMTRVMNHC